MYEWKKHIWFLGLIGGFVGLMSALDLETPFFTRRDQGMGIDFFAGSAWIACYWRGPYTGGPFDPYAHRSGAILLRVLGMLACIFFKIAFEWR